MKEKIDAAIGAGFVIYYSKEKGKFGYKCKDCDKRT
jgi:hypothetical protein